MLKHLLTIESAVYFTKPLKGLLLDPPLPVDFVYKLSKGSSAALCTVTLISPDGQRQEATVRFFQAHFNRDHSFGPSWVTECFLERFESILEGTEVWWNEPE